MTDSAQGCCVWIFVITVLRTCTQRYIISHIKFSTNRWTFATYVPANMSLFNFSGAQNANPQHFSYPLHRMASGQFLVKLDLNYYICVA